MKSLPSLVWIIPSLIFFAACGEQGTTEKIVEVASSGLDVVSSVKDLPKCTKDNEGEQALVKGETSVRVCVDGKWFATVVKDTSDNEFSCKTKELKDKSGLKIICNGDSIGVVYNGKEGAQGIQGEKGDKGDAGEQGVQGEKGEPGIQGEQGIPGEQGKQGKTGKQGEQGIQGEKGDPGEQGEKGETGDKGDTGTGCSIVEQTDSTVTIKCGEKSVVLNLGTKGGSDIVDTLELDSEKIAISLDTLTGFSQKGPFLKGSSVYLYELSDGHTLKQTNGNFTSVITSDSGRYRFQSRDLVSQYALIVVDGKYRNEVTGKPTATNIKLQAYTNMLMRKSANVNLLTHLEKDRVYNLVTQKNMTVRAAKKQAQGEIFKQFHFDTAGLKGESEDLDVFGKTDADAALLAISILLQRDSSETDLSVLLTDVSGDMETDGKWNGNGAAAVKATIADWVTTGDDAGKLALYRSNVEGWGLTKEVPHFEKFMRRFASVENGLGVCGSDSTPVGYVKQVTNAKSNYNAPDYAAINGKGGSIRFICVDADSAKWRVATDIEKDTMGWGHDFDDGDVRNGIINTATTYVYQNDNWRLGTYLDSVFVHEVDGGYACLENGYSTFKYKGDYYYCRGSWEKASELYNDTFESRDSCKTGGYYSNSALKTGRVSGKMYVCDNGAFRYADVDEIDLHKGCASYNEGESYSPEDQLSYYTCTTDGWVFDIEKNSGTLVDERDGKTYRIETIGNQVVMAENLNYEYPHVVYSDSYANGCGSDSCEIYGRFYKWYAAVDAGLEYSEGVDCLLSSGTECRVTAKPARGVCPEGWHIPDENEWKTLYGYMGDSPYAMQAKGFAGSDSALDTYGFSALASGWGTEHCSYFDKTCPYSFHDPDITGFWSTDHNESSGYVMMFLLYRDSAIIGGNPEDYMFPVRCFKD
ncbi:FISUMP domain-containing protein [uncultured Fibrobacter sp.]|uniref:FISUMP domain-containing protein n=1 Tax=uncultured Fibrobacter sp. TaxID=261512 RepID=UPI002628112E|nr:FISUMP domain-containing protein [uncultured Fibrobacter sp.]